MTSSSFCFPSTTKTVERCRCFIHFSGVSLSSQAVTSLSWWSWTPPNDNFNHSSEQMIKKVLILWQNRSQTAKDSFDIYELHLWQRDEGAPRTAFSVCLELRVHHLKIRTHRTVLIIMLSPILRRLCVTGESSTEEIEELPAENLLEKEKDEKEQPPRPLSSPRPDIEAADSRAISSTAAATLAKTEKMHHQHHHHRSIESSYSQVSMNRSRSHQQTLTKEEARKRMMSWRKTTRPRRESHALNSNWKTLYFSLFL